MKLDPLMQCLARLVDRRYRSDTVSLVDRERLGCRPDERAYIPSRWLTLGIALPRRTVASYDVFADIGSGKGRVVLQAARYPFRRVIGVELSSELTAVARENLGRVRRRLRAGSVELVTADAATWDAPDDLTIAYLYNPFQGHVFSSAIDRLAQVVDRRGTPMRIIYANPAEHARLVASPRVRELAPPHELLLRLAGYPPRGVRRYLLLPRARR